jgi:DNA-binding response OmpR family regulator
MLKLCIKVSPSMAAEALKELLPQAGIIIQQHESEADGIVYTPPHPETQLPSLNFEGLSFPIRFLDVLGLLENLPYTQEIKIAHFSLDLREKNLKDNRTNQIQRLTEKECQLLLFFYQQKGREVTKETLLKEIWSYHPDAETHTLETHIYRLRQKIEEDPNVPQILLNCKDGYRVQQ